jgi:hypothetical protein
MYGRAEDEWQELEQAGWEFLKEKAAERHGDPAHDPTVPYGTANAELAVWTGQPAFDFSQHVGRAAMGYLLGRISHPQLASFKAADIGPWSAIRTRPTPGRDSSPSHASLALSTVRCPTWNGWSSGCATCAKCRPMTGIKLEQRDNSLWAVPKSV